MATALHGSFDPCPRLVHRDVVAHLHAHSGVYDVLYGAFGALDFTGPRTLPPAAAAGRPATAA
ncbi:MULTISPECIES: hypothetical protein [unclassified Streptomyces]|uniref:hypothetical protein n=1 Tax=unclassified Streptomyces TaxID=2593676 RepID=UPI0033A267AF